VGKGDKAQRFGTRSFQFNFILADVPGPIAGADFLAAYRLAVDVAERRLFWPRNNVTLTTGFHLRPSVVNVQQLASIATQHVPATVPDNVRELLLEVPEILPGGARAQKPAHGVEHAIETTGRPVFAKARRLDPVKQRLAKKEFEKMEAAGICRQSDSTWASPLHMVPKKDGSLRPCGDYRRLNNVTVHDRYPVPHLADFSSNLANCRVFSKIDLIKGYYQVPVAEADIPKTAVITPLGLFEFVVKPFGLKNAAQSFQRMMDRIFRGLDFVFIYLDDVLVASKTQEDHSEHLCAVFQVLQRAGLVINVEKSLFFQEEIEFLGHQVSSKGIAPLTAQVQAVSEFKRPSTQKELQQFLGLINFYRRFLPAAARVLLPLTDSLRKSTKAWEWTDEMNVSFQEAKDLLACATLLAHPVEEAEISVACDASATHVGAVLQQMEEGSWRPLSFFSRKLKKAEKNYSTFDREMLATFLAIKHFRFFLEGREFTVLTDHKPLVAALKRVSPPASARQQRQLAYLSEFSATFQHTAGTDNVVADVLSRPSLSAIAEGFPVLDFEEMALLQSTCQD
jgi:hypothetical protein